MAEKTYPCEWAHGTGTTYGFMVEARLTKGDKMVAEKVRQSTGHDLSIEWQRLAFAKVPGPLGVPGAIHPAGLADGLVPYGTAQALRWWLIAGAGAMAFGLETRLVRHKLEYSYKQTAEEAIDEFGSDGNFESGRQPHPKGGENG